MGGEGIIKTIRMYHMYGQKIFCPLNVYTGQKIFCPYGDVSNIEFVLFPIFRIIYDIV